MFAFPIIKKEKEKKRNGIEKPKKVVKEQPKEKTNGETIECNW